MLLTDIPSSEPLTIHLFTVFFDTLAGSTKSSTGEQLGKNVEFNMTSVLVTMVDESQTLPSEVIDIIVAQFLRTDPRALSGFPKKGKKPNTATDEKQTTLVLKELPPAYNMAKTVCNTCPEKMARYISQYFNDVIVDASSSSAKPQPKKSSHRKVSDGLDDSDGENAGGPTDEDLKELDKVHRLLRELWRACPAVLQNVIPQLEAELSAENVHLRSLATETFGDIISGIGAAGPPATSVPDSAAYPPLSLSDTTDTTATHNILTKPSSPQPFPQVHQQAYSSFLGRSHDKSPIIRAAWTTGIGRILTTNAGGVGLAQQEQDRLITDLSRMLQDADEKVRIAAVRVVGSFSFRDVIYKLGASGGMEQPGSVLAVLAERVRDRKHAVRTEGMNVLARLWGVAAGAIATGEDEAMSTIGAAPSKILDTYYTNDLDIAVLLDHVLYEQLLPLSYPPLKAKAAKLTNGNSQKAKDGQANGDVEQDHPDPDRIRAERLLLLVKNLDERAKKVFFVIQNRQVQLAKVMTAFLQRCEDYNGGVMDQNEKQIKEHMSRLIDSFAKQFSDASKATDILHKFAKMHDRRSYQLIRFCMAPDSDYRTVVKAIKELTKRIEQSATSSQDMLDVMIPLIFRVSIIVNNKSHVPAIMEFSRSDEKSLAATAHELLREISTHTPEVLKAHVQEICSLLQEEAPSAKRNNDPGAVDNLKACASFASKFPKEIPQDRKFVQAMTSFALYGTPAEAAKHAVTILMKASDKKELLAKDLLNKCIKDFRYGGEGFVSRLASLSQLMLLAPQQVNEESDAVSDIAIQEVLLPVRTSSANAKDDYSWSADIDKECEAKCWALKILTNRVRSHTDPETLSEIADPIYKLLLNLVVNHGECSPSKVTPATHKSRLRLFAARLCLKLCTKKNTDSLLIPTSFNSLAVMAQDPLLEVRVSFLQRLRKYLGQQKLPQRFYTIPFLLAFEPNISLRSDTITWIRSRAAQFHSLKSQQPKANIIMESIFARLISLLAHHPDYSSAAGDLIDFARYIVFYLQCVASDENISLIYQIAQRIKQCQDAVSPSLDNDDHLYHLSDLSQLATRRYEDAHGWNIQALPGKVRLPTTLFTEMKDHEEAQQVAERNFLPEGVEEGIDGLIRASMKNAKSQGKKRRSEGGHDDGDERGSKRSKSLAIRKAPPKEKKAKSPKISKKPKRRNDEDGVPSSENRRRSGRANAVGGKYAERDSEDDDEEMAEGVAEWEYADGKVVKENGQQKKVVPLQEEEEDLDRQESRGSEEVPTVQKDVETEADELDQPTPKAATPKTSPKAKRVKRLGKGR